MVYLECVEGSSKKFWQIACFENFYTVVYGKIGTAGTVKVTKKKNAEEAAKKLIEAKKAKGYKEAVEDTSKFMHFDNINFKIAVINTLYYSHGFSDRIEEYYDIFCEEHYEDDDYDNEYYGLNIRAYEFIKYVKIPLSVADEIERISTEGGDELLNNIDLEWGGETEIFDIGDISDKELSQFSNLKEISVLTNQKEDLTELTLKCQKYGIKFSDIYDN